MCAKIKFGQLAHSNIEYLCVPQSQWHRQSKCSFLFVLHKKGGRRKHKKRAIVCTIVKLSFEFGASQSRRKCNDVYILIVQELFLSKKSLSWAGLFFFFLFFFVSRLCRCCFGFWEKFTRREKSSIYYLHMRSILSFHFTDIATHKHSHTNAQTLHIADIQNRGTELNQYIHGYIWLFVGLCCFFVLSSVDWSGPQIFKYRHISIRLYVRSFMLAVALSLPAFSHLLSACCV